MNNQLNTPPQDFKQFLHEVYDLRLARNQNYSLRAFSRSLGMEASTVSQIMRGKRKLTAKTIKKVGEKLSLAPDQIQAFQDPCVETTKDASSSFASLPFKELEGDSFRVVSDWYHFALLELMAIKDFRSDAHWAAKKLGLKPMQVSAAIGRLARLGLITIDEDGHWINTSGNNTCLKKAYTDAARRKLQTQILTMALDAVENIPIEDRDQTAMTLAVSRTRLDEVRDYITKFRRGLNAFVESTHADRTDVYQLAISFYPLTTSIKPKKRTKHV